MLSPDIVVAASLIYVAFLFLIAWAGDRRARLRGAGWLQSPFVYTLSISVYCTSWTFYGAVGSAARNGLEFATIYLGPTLVFVGWWWFLRKLLRIGRSQRITSIADLISSRYGKSASIAVLVTLVAVVGATPYIALQLKAVTSSYQIISGGDAESAGPAAGFWLAAGMAVFTILFGTRNVDANERHHGVVTAIAVESVVKLIALIAVGVYVVWGLAGGAEAIFSQVSPELLHSEEVFGPRWAALTFLSATAVICLPRQFQVTVVENVDERHLATASWMFPLYLLLISMFVLPIAAAGIAFLPAGENPDMFVLTLPLAHGQEALALFAFIGGFSSATSMVIVCSIAVSTMVSNHIVMPVALRAARGATHASGDVRTLLLRSRRASIVLILFLGFLYFRLSEGSDALASIGLIAFAAVAQFLPSIVGGLYWRQATKAGALAGLAAGAALWAYTLYLPSLGDSWFMSAAAIRDGPWGIAFLRPQAFLGLDGFDPLIHSLFWSLSANTSLLVLISLVRDPRPLEWLQSAVFVDAFRASSGDPSRFIRREAASEDLFILAQRILGAEPARQLFADAAAEQGLRRGLPHPTDDFIGRLERVLSGAVGAASAHAMVSQAASGETISLGELMEIADETAQLMEYSQRLAEKSRALELTAAELRRANAQLKELDAQKDDFLSQVSHELRTPMTSIRAFSEILKDTGDVDEKDVKRFIEIIHDESLRLTRLLDEILDLSVLERGDAWLEIADVDAEETVGRSVQSVLGMARRAGVAVSYRPGPPAPVRADPDRLAQVYVNLLSNAVKYNSAEAPQVWVKTRRERGVHVVEILDNGPGVPPEDRERIFAKFARGWDRKDKQGAGLGLAIAREIMRRMGGDLALAPSTAGACFRATLPLAARAAAAE